MKRVWMTERERGETFSQSRLKLIGIQTLPTNTSPFCLFFSPISCQVILLLCCQHQPRPGECMENEALRQWPLFSYPFHLFHSHFPLPFPAGHQTLHGLNKKDHKNSHNDLAARWKMFDSIHIFQYAWFVINALGKYFR